MAAVFGKNKPMLIYYFLNVGGFIRQVMQHLALPNKRLKILELKLKTELLLATVAILFKIIGNIINAAFKCLSQAATAFLLLARAHQSYTFIKQ